MKLGIGTYACTWAIGVPGYPPAHPMSVESFLAWAAELGLHLVQIADNLPLDSLKLDELRAAVRLASALDIEIEVGTRGIDPAHVRKYLRIANECGSRILRVVVDTKTHRPPPEEIVTLIRCALPDLRAAGVTLAIENHDRFTTNVLADIVEKVGDPAVGICLDTVNSFGALEGPEIVVTRLAPWVVNLHVKDFKIERMPHMMGFVVDGRPAGEGQLDLPWLLDAMRKHGRNPNAILELWPAPESSVDSTIEKEKEWARRSVTYLRGLIAD